MHKLLLLGIILLLHLKGASQFSFTHVFPLTVRNVFYGDTLLNTGAILKREGIRKVTALETSSQSTGKSSRKAEYLITNGRIDAQTVCLRHTSNSDPGSCLTDTLLYDASGRLAAYQARDGKGTPYIQGTARYLDEGKVKHTWISADPQRAASDTLINYWYYNSKGQMVRQEQEGSRSGLVNASLYYNEDGLLDSIRHDNPAWGTYVFTRKQKVKKKEIELQTATHRYKWVYAASGQCLSSEWSLKHRLHLPNRPNQELATTVKYYYNADGTLSKVVEKAPDDVIFTTVYTYSK